MINPIKTKSFWVIFVGLLLLAFIYGLYYAPNLNTVCAVVPGYIECYDWSTRFSTGFSLLKFGVLPILVVAILAALLIKK